MPSPISPVSRRRVLHDIGLVLTCLGLPHPVRAETAPSQAPDRVRILRAQPGIAFLGGPGPASTAIWGYEGAVPGPALRVKRGDEVSVRLINDLPEPTAIHWHGVRLTNAMDGAPPLTQRPIRPGETFDYRFTAPDAGTFWYHAAAPAQTGRGLSGVLIVDENEPTNAGRDVALMLQDWRPEPVESSTNGFFPTVNGGPTLDIPVVQGERFRLRLINASSRLLPRIQIAPMRAWVMAIDGQPAEPFIARDSQIALGPGNRIDLYVDPTFEAGEIAPIMMEFERKRVPIARLVAETPPPRRREALPDPKPLPANALPERMDFRGALRLDVPIESSATDALAPAPLFSIKRGRTAMLALINRTGGAHAVHLHGHHVRLLDRLDDGWKPFWLDTILVDARATARIAFVADNPGKWLIDGRAPAPTGMTGWFEVT
jgi:FtsP/CotA-like multicopper oxidase with cupredoxin domain